MKAHRFCESCKTYTHVSKSTCKDCGADLNKGKGPSTVNPSNDVSSKTTKVATKQTKTKVADHPSSNDLAQRVIELQNYIERVERDNQKREEKFETRLVSVEKQWRDWYNFQAELMHQRAAETFGGIKGELYLTEHGQDPKMYTKDGKFIPPHVTDNSANFSDEEPSDEVKRNTVAKVNNLPPTYLTGITKPASAPTVANAVAHVKYLCGQK